MLMHNRRLRVKNLPRDHGPYIVARVGFEPATFPTQGTKLTTEPPSPTDYSVSAYSRATSVFLVILEQLHRLKEVLSEFQSAYTIERAIFEVEVDLSHFIPRILSCRYSVRISCVTYNACID